VGSKIDPNNIPEKFKIEVYAIVDADTEEVGPMPGHPGVHRLPFCMLENALIDSNAIFDLIQPYADRTGLGSEPEVRSALEEVVGSLLQDEVRVRVKRKIGSGKWDISGATPEEFKQDKRRVECELEDILPNDSMIDRVFAEAKAEVAQIVAEGTQLTKFRGKQIIRQFHHRYARNAFPNERTFIIELARRITLRPEIAGPLETFANAVLDSND